MRSLNIASVMEADIEESEVYELIRNVEICFRTVCRCVTPLY
jgi:hypothetical protein